MLKPAQSLRRLMLLALCAASMGMLAIQAQADAVVWSCSRAEPEPEPFERITAFRVENLSAKEDYGIAITLSDLFSAFSGETIHMGPHQLAVCTLPVQDPLLVDALDSLGFTTQEYETLIQNKPNKLVLIPSVHQMQKCIAENHPAIGFFTDVVENERVGPCF